MAKDLEDFDSNNIEAVDMDREIDAIKKRNKIEDDAYGALTPEDIAGSRRKSLTRWFPMAFLAMIVMVALTALYTVMTDKKLRDKVASSAIEKIEAPKSGLSLEDDAYQENYNSAQLKKLQEEILRLRKEAKDEKEKVLLANKDEVDKNTEELKDQVQVLTETLVTMQEEMNVKIDEMAKEQQRVQDEILAKERRPADASTRIMPISKKDTIKNPLISDLVLPGYAKSKNEKNSKDEKKILKEVTVSKPKKVVKELTFHQKEILKAEAKFAGTSVTSFGTTTLNDESLVDEKKEEIKLHIMTGFSEATLITGVNAPTFGQGEKNPKPVILSIDSKQIIANGHDENLYDCMVIGQAYGNMNSKRAEIDITRLSCSIKKEGLLYKIENEIKGWVIGEDGQYGLKGRLVDSSGETIMRQLSIGFLQGVATAFSTPAVAVTGSAQQMFNPTNTKDAAYRGAGQGASTALNYLAEYYTKILDGLYPTVSIRAGRSVSILFAGGEDVQMIKYGRVNVDSDSRFRYNYGEMEIDKNGW